MTIKEDECVFLKIRRTTLCLTHIGYDDLLKKCTCNNCMKEKEAKRKYDSSKKNH